MFKHWNFHFALVLIFCWKTYLKVLPSLSQTVLSKIGKFLPHTNQQENLEGGALRFNTVPEIKPFQQIFFFRELFVPPSPMPQPPPPQTDLLIFGFLF